MDKLQEIGKEREMYNAAGPRDAKCDDKDMTWWLRHNNHLMV